MKIRLFPYLLISLFICTGCECHYEAEGVVYHKQSKQPLVGVAIDIYNPGHSDEMMHYQVKTLKDGTFRISHDECGDYMLMFSKPGFQTFTPDRKDQMEIYLDVESTP